MTSPILWPPCLRTENSNAWRLSGNIAGPGGTAAGTFPVARTDGGGVWMASLNAVGLVNLDALRCWNAIRTASRGGVIPVYVPRKQTLLQPYPLDANNRQITPRQIPHSDGSFFSDGCGYHQAVIIAATVGDAALRDTTLTIVLAYGGPLRGGESFAIYTDDQKWRVYDIETVIIDNNGNSVVTFSPPLRDDVPGGTAVDFEDLFCTMRLEKMDAMDYTTEFFPLPSPNASFVEYLYPP